MRNLDTLQSAKTRVLSIKYIRLLRWCMRSNTSWPGQALGEKVHFIVWYLRVYFLLQAIIGTYGLISYPVKYYNELNFFILGHCFLCVFLGTLTIVRTALPYFEKFGLLARKFFLSFHLIHFRHKGEYYEKMYTTIDKLSYYYTVYMILVMYMGSGFFNITVIYQNYRSGAFNHRDENTTLEFALYLSYPGFNQKNWFITSTLLNLIISYNAAVAICGIDTYLCIMVFQIIGHIQILRNKFTNFPRPKTEIVIERINKINKTTTNSEMYDAEENKEIHIKLVECIEYHKMIVTFTGYLSSLFGPMLAINYLFQLVSCCLCLLECSQGDPDALARFGPLSVIVFGQLIQVSCIFEVVATVSEKLIDNVYDIPWECMDTRNRRTVCILLHRVQTPIVVTAMGVTPVGVRTMSGILKTTFTYFTFLKSMNV